MPVSFGGWSSSFKTNGRRQWGQRSAACTACGGAGSVARVLLGFGLPVSGRWATPDTIRRIARRAEELGYASLWTFQRVLSPAGAALGPAHRSVLDPVLPLA